MEYTEQQKAGFRTTFAARRRNQLILLVPVVACMALLLLADETAGTALGIPVRVATPVALVGIAGALIYSLRNWRCPACNGYLGKVTNPSFCSKCGVALR